jgi:signal transduction histidine kinase
MVALTRRKQTNGSARASRIAIRSAEPASPGATRPRAAFEREHRRLERLCESLREGAEASQAAHGELLKNISHDIRNPLSTIIMSARMLERTIPPGERPRHYVDTIMRAAEELNDMLDDVSDARRIDAGIFAIERTTTDVGPMLAQALRAARAAAETRSVTISLELEEGTPAVLVDRERVTKVLSTFVINAVKFTPKQGQVRVRAEPEDDAVLFSISDTGPGIPVDEQPMAFTNGVAGSRKVQGAGLAFYVAKRIIEAHRGCLWLESEPGHGTTFFFTLPADEREDTEADL